MILNVTMDIPVNRRLEIELPADSPTGVANVEIRVTRPGDIIEVAAPVIDLSALPKYFDEQAGEWKRIGRSGVVREVRSV